MAYSLNWDNLQARSLLGNLLRHSGYPSHSEFSMGYPFQAIRCIKCWRKEPLIHMYSDPGSSVERIALVYTWKGYSYLQQNYPADQSSSGMGLGFFIWLSVLLRLQHGVLRKLQPRVLRKTSWVSGGRWAFTEISLGLVLCSDEAGCWNADLAPRSVWGWS